MLYGCCLFFCKPYGTGHENYNIKFAHSLTHLLVQLLHAHQVDGLEPVARRADEVEADVDAAVVVHGEVPLNLQLLLQEGLELAVDVVEDGAEAVLLVDLIAVADGVDEGELEVDVALLELVGVCLQPHARLLVALGRRVKTDAKMPYILLILVPVPINHCFGSGCAMIF